MNPWDLFWLALGWLCAIGVMAVILVVLIAIVIGIINTLRDMLRNNRK